MSTPYAKALDQIASHDAYLAGIVVLDDFLSAFNARDSARWAATLHYPHVRLAADEVIVWDTPEEYARSNEIERLSASGWHHTHWNWRRLIQADDQRLHFIVSFTRYDLKEQPLATYEALYVLTRRGSRWGIQARSSYAGIAVAGAAY